MAKLPDIRRGQRWADQSSSEWRDLVQQVAATMNLSVGAGLSIQKSATGISITLNRDAPVIREHDRTVVITRTPLDADKHLTVREATYEDIPPKPCTGAGADAVCFYRWAGPEFICYPPMGTKPIDFAGDEYVAGSDDVPPTLSTVFHRVHREHEVWVLEAKPEAGGGIRAAIVLSAQEGARTIHVQPVKHDTDEHSPTFGKWIADGEPFDPPTWGTQRGEDFQTLIGVPATDPVDVMPLIRIGGEWYAMQYFWMYSSTPNPAIPKGDCI